MTDTPLWSPDPARADASRMAAFRGWLATERGVEVADYQELWEWSTRELEAFWGALAEFLGVRFHADYERVLGSTAMPGAEWFPGSTLNYAEHALSVGRDDDVAVIFEREDGLSTTRTYAELRAEVASVRAALVEVGVQRGDRVVALAPNMPRTLVAFLAAASLGATWSSCSPDFGVRAVADRFTQIEPVVLFAVDGYVYNGREFDVRPTIAALQSEIPSLRATVLIDYLTDATAPDTIPWSEFQREGELAFDPVPFDHPLWVLYSSGTTGLPKGIVQGHGGIVVEHLKMLALHSDFGPGDRFFWFTTTGWMMWNYLVSALLVGATAVMYDGSPAHPDMGALWRLAAQHKVTYFGTSAPYIQSCLKAHLTPARDHDLSSLRALGSTGAPLSEEGFQWIADEIGSDVQICSVSGGTDLCTAFVGSAPDVPVWRGELSCRTLGAAVESWSPEGKPLVDEVGELVITKPMPSMPLYLWADEDGSKMRESYFEPYPGVWRHGDWIRITPRGSAVIYGRSDSTLNRGGVRMGTSEFYRVVEAFDEVADSLVIDTSADREGELVCFLVLADGVALEEVEPALRKALRSALSPRHVPDRFVVIAEVPRTLNGKKCEVPVKKILAGVPPEQAVSRDALANPAALEAFLPS
ncbi:acetoacetate--CoA ligase [Actinophytocola oryzae]|uniref:Acetoacetyl-CoA synthetase n=1 Tax=Actinophytocola oryzae TaxID=502181 RepID=A0A4R7VN32_9PSEU|nr:acetoacetate--CoA ligase [Actinophytocola oryzae]TDV51043.1 acetoacetyl-CoA synthetase [Actinophytocola oryzae]